MGRDNQYNLLANVIHDGKFEAGSFRVQIKNKALEKWYEIQDLYVTNIMAQSVIVSESYIHIYEKSNEKEIEE
jgi:U4/U6.U5 tri-snRNP-associated protein 2